MKSKKTKNYFSYFLLTAFYLLGLICSQSCYAGFETVYKDKLTKEECMKIQFEEGSVITPSIARQIVEDIASKPVRILELVRVYFEEDTFNTIMETLRTSQLSELVLIENRDEMEVGEYERIVLNILPQLQNLTKFNFCAGYVDDNYIIKIINALAKNEKIIELNLGDNDIGDSSVQVIAEFLRRSRSLLTLNLECNKIGEEGGLAIAEALRDNHTLINLMIEYNDDIGERGLQKILEALVRNVTIQDVKADWTPEQENVANIILERNGLIRQLSGVARSFVINRIINAPLGTTVSPVGTFTREEQDLIRRIGERHNEIIRRTAPSEAAAAAPQPTEVVEHSDINATVTTPPLKRQRRGSFSEEINLSPPPPLTIACK